jgi:hypothetical protein
MVTLDAFTRAFFECALWSTCDESRDDGGDPLDEKYTIEDIAPQCIAVLAAECVTFQRENAADLLTAKDAEHAGHDFWLTRNGHGAGFWDGDYPQEAGDRLTDASKAFGEVNLYVGDDGQIWAYEYI